MIDNNRVAIACSTGGFKGAFVHGVLSAFETAGFRVAAYAAASSSVLPAAAAAVGRSVELGLGHWLRGLQLLQRPGTGMSGMILGGIAENGPTIWPRLFQPGAPRFMIAASAVNQSVAEETQGKKARRRGRLLLLAAARGDRDWIENHLTPQLFDTASPDPTLRLTAGNIDQVSYASTRMLHAWDIPAWVDDRPYVDAYYTCACPAIEAAERGYDPVIALATEPELYTDIFQDKSMPDKWHGAQIMSIRPDKDPADQGVQYTTATLTGLQTIYQHGIDKGNEFLELTWQRASGR